MNGKKEKIASGLLNPFLSHLKAAQDQMAKGGYSIVLVPELASDATWFTRGTIERCGLLSLYIYIVNYSYRHILEFELTVIFHLNVLIRGYYHLVLFLLVLNMAGFPRPP